MRLLAVRKHFKLYILILIEVLFLIFMITRAFRPASSVSFLSNDFTDNIHGRDSYISEENGSVNFTYSPDDMPTLEGRPIGEELLTRKFSLGSGAYKLTAFYHSEGANAVLELKSDSRVTDMIAEGMKLDDAVDSTSSKFYVPFGSSLHDIQVDIRYFGPGPLSVSSVTLTEDISYRWIPITGYLFVFVFIDLLAYILFADSGFGLRDHIRGHYEIIVLCAIFVISSLPAFSDILYKGHDMDFHLARIISVSREIGYGQFPARMLTDMLHGCGYPTSTFYCDFFLYPFCLLYYIGLPLHMTWQAYIFAVNAATILITYSCCKKISGSRKISLTITALYVLSAYRLVDIFLRSAVGEFTAMTFIPLVILGIYSIYSSDDTQRPDWKYLALGMTCITLCHLLTLEILSVFLLIFCLMEYRKTFNVKRLAALIVAAVSTILMSCAFLVPMTLSMRSISLSMFDHQFYIQGQGAYPSQVFNIFMPGSGFSTIGTPEEMPLSLGGGILAALVFLVYMAIVSRKDTRLRRILIALTLISLSFSMYFFPWDIPASVFEGRMPALSRLSRMVQYPWRFLEITTVVLCISALADLKLLEDKTRRIWMAAFAFLTILSAGSFYNNFINDADWTRASTEEYLDASIGGEEYLPSGTGALSDVPLGIEVSPGSSADLISYEARDGKRYITASSLTDDTVVTIPVFAYPGYTATDPATGETFVTETGENQRIRINLPQGYDGTVQICYKEPSLWRVLELISAVSMICFAVYFIKTSRRPSTGS